MLEVVADWWTSVIDLHNYGRAIHSHESFFYAGRLSLAVKTKFFSADGYQMGIEEFCCIKLSFTSYTINITMLKN